MEPVKYYTKRLNQFRENENKLKRLVNTVSMFRLASMILFIWLLVRGIKNDNLLILISSFISLIIFFILVSYHKRKGDERNKTRELISINRNELEALKGNLSHFYDGKSYLDPEHEFTYDLDIFGPDSVYQYLCRCCTLEGRNKLAERIVDSPFSNERILKNQKIHRELSAYQDFLQEYNASGKLIEEKIEDSAQIKEWIDKKNGGFSLLVHLLALLLMLVNNGILILSFFIPGFINYLVISVLLSWLFYGSYMIHINRYHSNVGKKQNIIKKFNKLSEVIVLQDFEDDQLRENSGTLKSSIREVKALEIIMDLFDTRMNLLVGAVLNTLLLLDFHLIFILERWKKKNRNLLSKVFNIHAETDAWNSGAIYCFNNPGFAFPEIIETGFVTKKIGHPLIPPGKCVLNDFQFVDHESIIMITGANMAGKSTFLRTIGVNLCLAGIGLPVMAEKFDFEPNPLLTGMRTTDSLAESESYFFAELKRLKKIMERLRKGEKLYILLDEILKGTNSIDKHAGSEELLRQIADFECKVFIATHDLELGKLEKNYPDIIRNYHFESYIQGNKLSFDYKLQHGIAVNMNASFLLNKMGILKK